MDTHGHDDSREKFKWSMIGLGAALVWLGVVSYAAYLMVPAAH